MGRLSLERNCYITANLRVKPFPKIEFVSNQRLRKFLDGTSLRHFNFYDCQFDSSSFKKHKNTLAFSNNVVTKLRYVKT